MVNEDVFRGVTVSVELNEDPATVHPPPHMLSLVAKVDGRLTFAADTSYFPLTQYC